jgi:hypothetical protein
VVTARVARLSITLGTERGRFVHFHAADGVDGHINSVSFDWFSGVTTAIQKAVRDDG